jgi:hypothetical protein
VLVLLISATLAVAGWHVARWAQGDKGAPSAGSSKSARVEKGETSGSEAETAGGAEGEAPGAGESGASGESASRDAQAANDPDLRYVTETQRHQNFFTALAEGQVKRLDVTATDFQPAGDPNTSYVYVVVATADGARSDGSIVMKYSGGLWRIGAVRLPGVLAGGTDLKAPDSFEADLARELSEQQDFLTKVAEGRLAYMTISSVDQTGDSEVLLTGRAASKGGNTFPAEMRLRKDYGLWHLTGIVAL